MKSLNARLLKTNRLKPCPLCGVTMMARASQANSAREDTFECVRCQLTIFAPPLDEVASQR